MESRDCACSIAIPVRLGNISTGEYCGRCPEGENIEAGCGNGTRLAG